MGKLIKPENSEVELPIHERILSALGESQTHPDSLSEHGTEQEVQAGIAHLKLTGKVQSDGVRVWRA